MSYASSEAKLYEVERTAATNEGESQGLTVASDPMTVQRRRTVIRCAACSAATPISSHAPLQHPVCQVHADIGEAQLGHAVRSSPRYVAVAASRALERGASRTATMKSAVACQSPILSCQAIHRMP